MKRYSQVTRSFTDYFKEEKDVYVQNLSNTQVSLQFGSMPNITSVLIPDTRKPFNLSQHVSFKDLKDSNDLRKMLNRRPPTLVLLEASEFNEFYEDLAREKGTTADEEIAQAFEQQLQLMQRRKPVEETPKPEEKAPEPTKPKQEDLIPQPKPRIVGMCVDENLSASDFLEYLRDLKGELTQADYEYLQAHAKFKTVQSWAVKQLSA